MNNQEAIRLIRNHPTMCEFPDAYGEPYYDAVDMAITALQEQEAKHSTESSSTHKALDTISRQAAINTVKKHYRVDNDLLEVIVYQLENLPSAQPEPCEDCVSRQAAIDAALSAFSRGLLASPDIRRLPSAHPEWNNHTVACLLAELFDDTCACNYNGIDEWLPGKCELLDSCPNPVGVACWEQYLKHRAERRTD